MPADYSRFEENLNVSWDADGSFENATFGGFRIELFGPFLGQECGLSGGQTRLQNAVHPLMQCLRLKKQASGTF